MFAKIFETEELGQILVKKGHSDLGCPELQFFWQPPGFGVCMFAIEFFDNDSGWNAMDQEFEKIDPELAMKLCSERTLTAINGAPQ